jgi:hypothetical protein
MFKHSILGKGYRNVDIAVGISKVVGYEDTRIRGSSRKYEYTRLNGSVKLGWIAINSYRSR